MARIIPGVEVRVVKEVVPKQLAPSGVLGLIGLTEHLPADSDSPVAHAGSWNTFVELFGAGSGHSMPQAQQALNNGVFELVVSPVAADAAAAANVTLSSDDETPVNVFTLTARAPGIWANGTQVTCSARKGPPGMGTFDVSLQKAGSSEVEFHKNVNATPGTPRYVVDVLNAESSLVTAAKVAATQLGAIPEATGPTLLAPPTGGTVPRFEAIDPINGLKLLIVKAKSDAPSLQAAIVPMSNGFKIQIFQEDAKAAGTFIPVEQDDLEDLITIEPGPNNDQPYETTQLPGTEGILVEFDTWLAAGTNELTGGADAGASAYRDALALLEDEPDVDMVLAAIQDFSNTERFLQIHGDVISHCNKMSTGAKGRIGFGEVPPTGTTGDHTELAEPLTSDRFVMIAPNGVVGAVVGMIGSLPYYYSPTFKPISGIGKLKALGTEDRRALLQGNVVPVGIEPRRGIIVLRGLTTDGDQINVRRVADHAVRGVKMIGDLFIGQLNTAIGRSALRQKLTEFLIQMQNVGAIVPSTDGSDPAFKVDVYSSQNDFALGIVRVDIAVRPVRAMDYIYATVLIQV